MSHDLYLYFIVMQVTFLQNLLIGTRSILRGFVTSLTACVPKWEHCAQLLQVDAREIVRTLSLMISVVNLFDTFKFPFSCSL